MKTYIRKPFFGALWNALHGKPNLIQVVLGPRQVGKTTLALQVLDQWNGAKLYETADQPNTPSVEWILTQWHKARSLGGSKRKEVLLVLDEIQKIPRWSEVVKKLFDEERRSKTPLRIILLGSSSLLVQRGLAESLAGRFEIQRHPHWSYPECHEYFSTSLEEYLYFGGYPAAIQLHKDETRWARYIRDSLIETVLSKDVLLMTPVSKPALLRQVFGLVLQHPAEILSYQKMLGTLHDAGNTTTVASYLRLLSHAFLLNPLERWSGSRVKQRGSIPKLLILDNALVSATVGRGFNHAKSDKAFWGRMIENAVGARLHVLCQEFGMNLFYWRDRQEEVDYVIQKGNQLIAIEVKNKMGGDDDRSLFSFLRRYKNAQGIFIAGTLHKNQVPDEPKNIRRVSLEQFFKNSKDILDS